MYERGECPSWCHQGAIRKPILAGLVVSIAAATGPVPASAATGRLHQAEARCIGASGAVAHPGGKAAVAGCNAAVARAGGTTLAGAPAPLAALPWRVL